MRTEQNIEAGERTQHTPGPWEAIDHETSVRKEPGKTFVFAPGQETLVADCHCLYGQSVAESEANARLIAAAPELLRIVAMMKEWLDAGSSEVHFDTMMPDESDDTLESAVRAAITKAEGRN